MRKTLLLFVVIMAAITMLAACSNKNDGNTFRATVLENNGTNLLVEPAANTTEIRSADKVSLSVTEAAIVNSNDLEISIEEIKTGSQVEISYSGGLAESYPAQIYDCYKVKLLD